MGLCPVFFPPFSWLLTMRSRRARAIFVRISAQEGVTCIDLFREKVDDILSRNPRRYYAGDRLHPTSESYHAAYHAICEGSQLRRVLSAVSNEVTGANEPSFAPGAVMSVPAVASEARPAIDAPLPRAA
ncbi:MAG: SGNH/GDSL hydrolase family protein [Pseudomonadota bacterium]|nr:SGNH/GDSL hydrolase family protein [Pseudomonadota bacterium]